MVWYSYLFKNFPQFVMIHTVKGFSIVNDAEVDFFFFLEFPCFFYDPTCFGNLLSGSSTFFWIWLVQLEVLSSHSAGV